MRAGIHGECGRCFAGPLGDIKIESLFSKLGRARQGSFKLMSSDCEHDRSPCWPVIQPDDRLNHFGTRALIEDSRRQRGRNASHRCSLREL